MHTPIVTLYSLPIVIDRLLMISLLFHDIWNATSLLWFLDLTFFQHLDMMYEDKKNRCTMQTTAYIQQEPTMPTYWHGLRYQDVTLCPNSDEWSCVQLEKSVMWQNAAKAICITVKTDRKHKFLSFACFIKGIELYYVPLVSLSPPHNQPWIPLLLITTHPIYTSYALHTRKPSQESVLPMR